MWVYLIYSNNGLILLEFRIEISILKVESSISKLNKMFFFQENTFQVAFASGIAQKALKRGKYTQQEFEGSFFELLRYQFVPFVNF